MELFLWRLQRIVLRHKKAGMEGGKGPQKIMLLPEQFFAQVLYHVRRHLRQAESVG